MASIQLRRHEAESGDLPAVCMCCGAPATVRKRLRFISHPLWVYIWLPLGLLPFVWIPVLLPLGFLPYFLVAAILTVRVRCYTLFCERHKNHWRVRTLMIWAAFVAILVFLFGGIVLVGMLSERLSQSAQDRLFGSVCIASPMLLLLWLVSIPVMQLTSIHPADITERRLTLKRISPAFAEAVREYRKNRPAEEEPENHPRKRQIRRSPPNHRDREK